MLESWGHDVGLVMVSGGTASCIEYNRSVHAASHLDAHTSKHHTTPHTHTQIMDTPRPEQIRTMQPDAPEATEADCLELMEMILGALGR